MIIFYLNTMIPFVRLETFFYEIYLKKDILVELWLGIKFITWLE